LRDKRVLPPRTIRRGPQPLPLRPRHLSRSLQPCHLRRSLQPCHLRRSLRPRHSTRFPRSL